MYAHNEHLYFQDEANVSRENYSTSYTSERFRGTPTCDRQAFGSPGNCQELRMESSEITEAPYPGQPAYIRQRRPNNRACQHTRTSPTLLLCRPAGLTTTIFEPIIPNPPVHNMAGTAFSDVPAHPGRRPVPLFTTDS